MIYDIDGNVISGGESGASFEDYGGKNDVLYWSNDVQWHNGDVSASGSFSSSASDFYKSIFSNVLYLHQGCVITCASGYTVTAVYFSDKKASAFLSGTSGTSITVNSDCYAVLSLKKTSNGKTVPADGENVTITGTYEVVTHSIEGRNLGQRYRVSRLRQLSEVEVMPTAQYPTTSGNVAVPSTPFIGIPYSAATRTEGYVGTDVSLYTYLSAVSNPRSVIYTEIFEDYLARCYYGTDCAGTFWAGMGVHDTLTTLVMQTSDELQEITNLALLQVGDALLKNGHCEDVCYVEKDKHGRIVLIGVHDAWTPYMRRTWFWWDELVAHVQSGGHRLLRFNGVYNSEGSPFNYPFPDDPGTEFIFPKIMPKLGDKVSVLAGKTIDIHVLDSSGYSAISVYKDGTQVDTKSSASDFSIQNAQDGHYEVRMTGTGETQSCFFHVGNITMTISGNNAVFSASGGFTPYMISAYAKDAVNASGWATGFTGKKVVKKLSESEIAAGTANITDLLTYARNNQGYLKIKAYDDYGTIFRRIEL